MKEKNCSETTNNPKLFFHFFGQPVSCTRHPVTCTKHPVSCTKHPVSCINHPVSCKNLSQPGPERRLTITVEQRPFSLTIGLTIPYYTLLYQSCTMKVCENLNLFFLAGQRREKLLSLSIVSMTGVHCWSRSEAKSYNGGILFT